MSNLTPISFPWYFSQPHTPPDFDHNNHCAQYGGIDDILYVPNHRFWLRTIKTAQETIKKVVAVVNGQTITMKRLDTHTLCVQPTHQNPNLEYWYCDSPTRCTKAYDYFFVAKVAKPLSPRPTSEEVWLPPKETVPTRPFHASVSEWGKVSWFNLYGQVRTGDTVEEHWIMNTTYELLYVQNLSGNQVSLEVEVGPQPMFSLFRTDPPILAPMVCGDCCTIVIAYSDPADENIGNVTLTARNLATNRIVMRARITLHGYRGPT